MAYILYKLQNASGWDNDQPTIVIDNTHPEWKQALENWRNGKNPTASPLWEKGVWMLSKLKEESG